MIKIGEKVHVDQLKDGINEITISMGRILLKRHQLEDGRREWKIWRLENDRTATLVDYGFNESRIRKFARDLVMMIL